MKTGYLNYRWYVYEDQGFHSLGKWVVTPLDEDPNESDIEPVAVDLTNELAEHIVTLHNQWVHDVLGGEIVANPNS